MDPTEAAVRRMRNLGLTRQPVPDIESVIRGLGAVQSQDYGPAKWSIAQRMKDMTNDALDRAFDEGTFLRTHALRPTWHFLLAEDIRWVQELTGPRVQAQNRHYYRKMELDESIFKKSNSILKKALSASGHLTRNELQGVLSKAGIEAEGMQLAYILMFAELDCLICSGPLKGKQHTYALVEDRAPAAILLSPDEALAELTSRFFTSHGPATIKDFRWWSSLTVKEIRRGLEMCGSKLDTDSIDGVDYWFPKDERPRKTRSVSAHLLQAYDEYWVGYSESKYVFDRSQEARRATQARTHFAALTVLGTQVAGHWRRKIEKDSLLIEALVYEPIDRSAERALESEAQRHGRFMDLPTTFSLAVA